MIKLWSAFAGILLYMEFVYHFGGYGATGINPVFIIGLAAAAAAGETALAGSVPAKWKKRVFWIFAVLEYLLYGAQLVYLRIFRQPLLWEAAFRGGGDALTNYWREALDGILKASPYLLLLALPLIAAGALFILKKWELPHIRSIGRLRCLLTAGVGIIVSVTVIFIGKYIEAQYYEDYHEFYDPYTVARDMGVLTLVQRDTAVSAGRLLDSLFTGKTGAADGAGASDSEGRSPSGADGSGGTDPGNGETGEGALTDSGTESGERNTEGAMPPVVEEETGGGEGSGSAEKKPADTSPHVLNIDFGKLKAEAAVKETAWLAEYMEGLAPTKRNEYTGIFEGYNLIYLTAEGFSTYAVREDLTPTLYRLINSGFVFENYYVPLWQTSTSDGEYINCTGLIPDGQFSMRKSGENDMEFTLPRYFEDEGVESLAYHNNSLSYYDRYLTHTNLGYDFKAAKLGELPEEEWGDKIFPMEHPDAWPASDLEMMQGTVPDYIGKDRFNVYYMTVSGHMNYNFKGNAMSGKNREAVEGLDMSENARAYIACNIELDKALEYLLGQLEAAGKLENTVICMSADHYPYGMTEAEYEELAGKELSENMDLYRNSLVLWNAGMEKEPVRVEKVCGSMDLVPTLLNLFGFDYDSRLYAGRDIFSDTEGLVIFNDRSFVSDTVFYSRKAKTTVWREDLDPAGSVDDDSSGSGSTDDAESGSADEAAPGKGSVDDAAPGKGSVDDAASGSGSVDDAAPGNGTPGQSPSVGGGQLVPGRPLPVPSPEDREQYMTDMKKEVKNRYQFSAIILQQNYYKNIAEAMVRPEQ